MITARSASTAQSRSGTLIDGVMLAMSRASVRPSSSLQNSVGSVNILTKPGGRHAYAGSAAQIASCRMSGVTSLAKLSGGIAAPEGAAQ